MLNFIAVLFISAINAACSAPFLSDSGSYAGLRHGYPKENPLIPFNLPIPTELDEAEQLGILKSSNTSNRPLLVPSVPAGEDQMKTQEEQLPDEREFPGLEPEVLLKLTITPKKPSSASSTSFSEGKVKTEEALLLDKPDFPGPGPQYLLIRQSEENLEVEKVKHSPLPPVYQKEKTKDVVDADKDINAPFVSLSELSPAENLEEGVKETALSDELLAEMEESSTQEAKLEISNVVPVLPSGNEEQFLEDVVVGEPFLKATDTSGKLPLANGGATRGEHIVKDSEREESQVQDKVETQLEEEMAGSLPTELVGKESKNHRGKGELQKDELKDEEEIKNEDKIHSPPESDMVPPGSANAVTQDQKLTREEHSKDHEGEVEKEAEIAESLNDETSEVEVAKVLNRPVFDVSNEQVYREKNQKTISVDESKNDQGIKEKQQNDELKDEEEIKKEDEIHTLPESDLVELPSRSAKVVSQDDKLTHEEHSKDREGEVEKEAEIAESLNDETREVEVTTVLKETFELPDGNQPVFNASNDQVNGDNNQKKISGNESKNHQGKVKMQKDELKDKEKIKQEEEIYCSPESDIVELPSGSGKVASQDDNSKGHEDEVEKEAEIAESLNDETREAEANKVLTEKKTFEFLDGNRSVFDESNHQVDGKYNQKTTGDKQFPFGSMEQTEVFQPAAKSISVIQQTVPLTDNYVAKNRSLVPHLVRITEYYYYVPMGYR